MEPRVPRVGRYSADTPKRGDVGAGELLFVPVAITYMYYGRGLARSFTLRIDSQRRPPVLPVLSTFIGTYV